VPALTSFYLYLTNGCNLRCRHCWITPKFVNGEPDPGDCLDLDLLRKAVREAKPLGLSAAKLTGGEPVLHPSFIEIVDFLSAEGLDIVIETNGTLVDAALAHHLKKNTTVSFISVSLDGPTAEIHDVFRGVKGSFDAAVRGIRHFWDAGFRPQIITSLHSDNLKHVQAMVDLAVALDADSLKFSPVMPMGRGKLVHKQGKSLGPEEILRLAHFVRGELQARTPIRLIINTPLAHYTVQELMQKGADASCHVLNILGILGTGDMALCGIGSTIPELCYGNLQEHSIPDVWLNHPKLRQLREDLQKPYPGICGECIHARRCLTWCIAMNYQISGQMVTPAWLCAEAQKKGLFPLERLRS
jgi:SynChlorMet cassette radical SAM/SPASM protein ScmF